MYEIVQFPSGAIKFDPEWSVAPGWYILRCDQHGLHFGANGTSAIKAASKHLHGAGHGQSREFWRAIKELGVLVENCDAQKAKRNNVAIYRVIWGKWRKMSEETTNAKGANCNDVANHPEEGTPQVLFDEDDGRFWAVMVFPSQRSGSNFESSVFGKLPMGFYDDAPLCYKRQPDGNLVWENNRLQWADGYQDGGHLASNRLFPVVYFSRADPSEARVGWASASKLQPLNFIRHKGVKGAVQAKRYHANHHPMAQGDSVCAVDTVNGTFCSSGRDMCSDVPAGCCSTLIRRFCKQ